jgi:hypothetical protein
MTCENSENDFGEILKKGNIFLLQMIHSKFNISKISEEVLNVSDFIAGIYAKKRK